MDIFLPEYAKNALEILHNGGFEAYIVGGSVRDSLLGLPVSDFDITTSAQPEDICRLFSDYKQLLFGMKHGTVAVIIDNNVMEITTYRKDGEYTDCRHPDDVSFTGSLSEDLSRRDFTVNAMCYNPEDGIIDESGGLTDLKNKIIRTVGDPDKRFSEDALRIMRGIRFAAVLGFTVDAETSQSIHKNKELLSGISAERLFGELIKLITGKDALRILLEYGDVLGVIIPDIVPALDFKQYGKKHCYTVWEHICHTVDNIENDKLLRLTMLLHDLGKVPTAALDEKGNSTFKNHAAVGAQMAEKSLIALRTDNDTVKSVTKLISYHDFEIPQTLPEVRHLLRKVGRDTLEQLLLVKTADRGALSPEYRDVSSQCAAARMNIARVFDENLCYSLDTLALNGNSLKSAGVAPENIGKVLNLLLDAVIEEKCPNEKEALRAYLPIVY